MLNQRAVPVPLRGATPAFKGDFKPNGFTLLELIIAVVVVAILASIAMPSFLDAIRKSRRSEAIAALNTLQQAQERFRSNNLTYANNLTAAPTATPTPGLGLTTTTPSGYYTVALVSGNVSSYEATATAVAGTSQANDGNCAQLGVKFDAGGLLYASGTAGSTFSSSSYTASNPCWAR
ncbi:MAG: type IV pilin protein [Rubrivivax sp.]